MRPNFAPRIVAEAAAETTRKTLLASFEQSRELIAGPGIETMALLKRVRDKMRRTIGVMHVVVSSESTQGSLQSRTRGAQR
jgi:hypothetical protein